MSIPFVFAFSKNIREVHYDGISYSRKNELTKINENLAVIEVVTSYGDNRKSPKSRKVLVSSDEIKEVSIATFIDYCDGKYSCCSLKNMPKLFCSFPLIGTEDFSFPVILNSPNFKVLKERNYIQEGAETNQEILHIAVKLYEKIMDYVCQHNWNDLYNLCYMNETKGSTLQTKIFSLIQSIYQIQPIVDVQDNSGWSSKKSLCFLDNGKSTPNIIIPSMSKSEYNDELWDIISHVKTKPIPTRESYQHWLAIAPDNKIMLKSVYTYYLKSKNLSELCQQLNNSEEVIPWLNNLYNLWIKCSNENDFTAAGIVPNQNGDFVGITKLYRDNNIDNSLKEVLTLFGTNIKSQLLFINVTALDVIQINSFDNEIIADKISNHIRKQLSDESSNTLKRTQEIQNIFNMLTD